MIDRVAFRLIINAPLVCILVGLVLGILAYIILAGTDRDRELFTLKNRKFKLSLVAGVGLAAVGILIAVALWIAGVSKPFVNPIDIYWYAIMIVTGMIAAIVAAIFMSKKKGFGASLIVDMALVLIPLGIIGARLWFVIFPYEGGSHNFQNFWDVIDIRDGGLGIYGGIIFGAIGVVIVSFWKKISVLKLLDIVAPCVLIAQAIGRWGNFFNQEAYGYVTNVTWFPFSVYIEADGKYHLATFFYEFLWNCIGFGLIYWYCYTRNRIDGIGICSYFLWYGAGRSWIECLRTDSLYIGSLRVSVVFSIIMIAASLGFGAYLIWNYKKTGRQLFEKSAAVAEGSADTEDNGENKNGD